MTEKKVNADPAVENPSLADAIRESRRQHRETLATIDALRDTLRIGLILLVALLLLTRRF